MTIETEDLAALLKAAQAGERRSLAKLISAVERGAPPPAFLINDAASSPINSPNEGQSKEHEPFCIGITGAPGAGKSTLVSALTDALLVRREKAAVLAVDPSSPISRGALLGDRVRMDRHSAAPNVFIRSMATRSQQGGLAGATQAARRILQRCQWPLVLIETVGVGQVELDIVNTADLAVVVLNPGWGDEIQANKAGLMEIADIFVINKADRPELAATRRDIEAVMMTRPANARPPLLETVATRDEGIDALAAAIWEVRDRLRASGELARRRQRQLQMELSQRITQRFKRTLEVAEGAEPFARAVAAISAGECDLETAARDLLEELTAI